MSDYMFDGDAHNAHSLDYNELPRDLWSLRTNEEYIGVMATWADSTFVLKEVLLTIQLLPSSHIAENIKNSLNQIITE
ncbi:13162_t:CDS:2 [Dentiscutata heterogama]|uniref:13162_t:CDS:1 n=1 Tax=Dentiscutata heterogama TaxID=1316150 RepID=A0ACA9MVU0_9GLOM|nr:13162_t:CDS:2 [Dentiscutata heterogama]